METKEKNILFVLANRNFEDTEYFESKKIFDKEGYKTKTASSYINEATGMLGGIVNIDMLFTEVDALLFDAIIYIGGQGVIMLWDDWRAKNLSTIFLNNKKIVAAIGSGCVIISNAGILKNMNATCEKIDEGQLMRNGATMLDEDIVVSDSIITARSSSAVKIFPSKIIELIK